MGVFRVFLAITAILLTTIQAEPVVEERHATTNTFNLPPASKPLTPSRILAGKDTSTTDVDDSTDESSGTGEERASPLQALENAVKTSTSKLRGATLKARSHLWLKANKQPGRLFTTLRLSGLDDQQLLNSAVFRTWVKYADAFAQKLGRRTEGDVYALLRDQSKLGELQIARVLETLRTLPGYEKLGAKFQENQFSSWYVRKLKPNDLNVKAEGTGGMVDTIMQRYSAQVTKYKKARLKNELLRDPMTRYDQVKKALLD